MGNFNNVGLLGSQIIATGATTTSGLIYNYPMYQQAGCWPAPEPAKPKEPETALEWLDRRVEEMRVAL